MPTRPRTHRPTRAPPPRPYDAARASSAARGYDRRWRRYRAAYLGRHPLCVLCEKEGRSTPAEHIDHIRAVEGGQADPLFWVESNHRGLCASCHSRKTVREDGGLGR